MTIRRFAAWGRARIPVCRFSTPAVVGLLASHVALLGLVPHFARAAELPLIEVTTCGQVLTNQAGYLSANLTCTGVPGDSVVLHNANLDLRGFTLTGGNQHGVHCEGRCDITSTMPGGTISTARHNGIDVGYDNTIAGAATVSNITITGCGNPDSFQPGAHDGNAGVRGWWLSSITLSNVIVTETVGDGVNTHGKKLVIEGSQITNNQSEGVKGQRIKISNSTLSGNGGNGVEGVKVSATSCDFVNNGGNDLFQHGGEGPQTAVRGGRIKVFDSTISSHPVAAAFTRFGKVSFTNTMINNNTTGVLLISASASLKDSSITGSTVDAISGSHSLVKLTNTMISGNRSGIFLTGGKILAKVSQIIDNDIRGVWIQNGASKPGVLISKATDILGNFQDPNCGVSIDCVDIGSQTRPKFVYQTGVSECDLSYRIGFFPDSEWGVCFFDCGNGSLTAGEICDESGETTTCDDDCTTPACGDGNTNQAANEQCDDGNVAANDGCDSSCIEEFCGDGIAQSGIGEACDTGAVNQTTCDEDCTLPMCGDGLRNSKAGEQCDDGNLNNGDGCSSACRKE